MVCRQMPSCFYWPHSQQVLWLEFRVCFLCSSRYNCIYVEQKMPRTNSSPQSTEGHLHTSESGTQTSTGKLLPLKALATAQIPLCIEQQSISLPGGWGRSMGIQKLKYNSGKNQIVCDLQHQAHTEHKAYTEFS